MSKSWTVILEEDPETGELILPFPPEFLEGNDWRTGDNIKFIVSEENNCIIENLSWQERHKNEVVES